MPKFKVGDHIKTVSFGRGFEDATVLGIFTSKEKSTKDKEMYLLKILNGTATIPISAEVNYTLVKTK